MIILGQGSSCTFIHVGVHIICL